jgi:hypothetical protein
MEIEAFVVLKGIHNVLRWVVLVVAVAAIGGAWHGVFVRRPFVRSDRMLAVGFVATMHIQLLLGLTLYANSPIVRASFADFGLAMSTRAMRFYAVEHITMMILAVAAVTVGSVLARKTEDDGKKHKRAAIWFTLGLVLILAGMPWAGPWMPTFTTP